MIKLGYEAASFLEQAITGTIARIEENLKIDSSKFGNKDYFEMCDERDKEAIRELRELNSIVGYIKYEAYKKAKEDKVKGF